uniref:Voltage-gated potassium channel n=1 Tax=Candidatus Kentrum eta TaxID=2126337 RepID=A0A450VAJ0_9GAMM|nr:MAG: voltage-gated potassium channel [Candidatus Kentron sp. H]VFK01790.1 MAG: voltage-gated potassium channel [Candidatus Kentron sp. H]VFK05159.1 MAG: voltage-gated potassium channel [Candidatus Kentron sp. H]
MDTRIIALKRTIEATDTVSGRVFDIFIQVVIILSVISFSVETIPGLSPSVIRILTVMEIVTVVIFTTEYLLRILVADNRIRFAFSFFGIVDLLAILPFYLTVMGIDLRPIRVLRLLQVVRILKLARYSESLRRFHLAFGLIKQELLLFSLVAVIVLYLSAVGIYYFERLAQPEVFQSVFHSLWWAISTLTTVGYGDVFPITVGGKIFTFFVLVIGLGIVAVPSGLMASALTSAREIGKEELRERAE